MKTETVTIIVIFLVLIPVTIIDLKEKRIPDIFTYSGIILLLLIKTVMKVQPVYQSSLLIISGFIPFFLIWLITKGKLGLGDAKLSAFLSLALGIRGWLAMIFISSLAGIFFAVIMLVFKKMDRKTRIPYAPFMSFGALVALFII